MPIPNPQDDRIRALEAEYGRVTTHRFPDGALSLVAWSPDGFRPVAAELVGLDGQPITGAAAIRQLGNVRAAAEGIAAQATDDVVAHLAARILAGEPINVTEAARDGGYSRTTLYRRLEDLGLDPANPPAGEDDGGKAKPAPEEDKSVPAPDENKGPRKPAGAAAAA